MAGPSSQKPRSDPIVARPARAEMRPKATHSSEIGARPQGARGQAANGS